MSDPFSKYKIEREIAGGSPSVHEALGLISPHKSSMVAHTGTFNTQEIEAGLSGVHGQPQLHSEFEDSLEYCLKTKQKLRWRVPEKDA